MVPSPPAAAPPLPDGSDELFGSNVLVVTGKGGVGKTTVAAALARTAAASGRRTLLLEVEGRQGLAPIFGTAPWDHEEREFRPGLWGASIDPAASVYEYLELFYGLKRVQWLMERSNAIDFVTAAAPGLRDLLLIGKVYEIEARRRADGRRTYDLIVVDAPPTGRIIPFLGSPDSVTDIVRVGPIRRQAGQIRTMLTNPRRCRCVVVTLLEEMPVEETVEGVAQLRSEGIAVAPVVANQVQPPRPELAAATEAGLDPDGLRASAAAAGLELSPATAARAVDLADAYAARSRLQQRLRSDLAERTGLGQLDLPSLPDATIDETAVGVLADVLALQLGERADRRATHAATVDPRP